MTKRSEISQSFIDKVNALIESKFFRNKSEVVDKLGWNFSAFSDAMRGKRPVPLDIVEKLNEISKNANYVLRSEAKESSPNYEIREVYSPKNEGENINLSKGRILHVPIYAEAGFLAGDTDPVTNDDLLEWWMPGFDGPGYSFPVKGESMYPTFKDGEVVITSQKQVRYDEIRNGFIHVLITNKNILIKRIEKDKKVRGLLHLTCDNPEYPTIDVNYDDVKIYRARRNVSWDLEKKYK